MQAKRRSSFDRVPGICRAFSRISACVSTRKCWSSPSYVAFFFVVAQLISWLVFGQPPTVIEYVGGAFILVGAMVLSVARIP